MSRRSDVLLLTSKRGHVGGVGTGFLLQPTEGEPVLVTALHNVGRTDEEGAVQWNTDVRVGYWTGHEQVELALGERIMFDPVEDWAAYKIAPPQKATGLEYCTLTDESNTWSSYGWPNPSERPDGNALGGKFIGTETPLRREVGRVVHRVVHLELEAASLAAGEARSARGYSGAPVMVGGRVVGMIVHRDPPRSPGSQVAPGGVLYALPIVPIVSRLQKDDRQGRSWAPPTPPSPGNSVTHRSPEKASSPLVSIGKIVVSGSGTGVLVGSGSRGAGVQVDEVHVDGPGMGVSLGEPNSRMPSGALTSLESFLEGWSNETTPPLPPQIVLLGRAEQRKRLLEWLTQPSPDPLSIQAASKREALIFAAAVIDSVEEEEQREELLARTLIVENAEAWRSALRQKSQQPLILLPNFSELEVSASASSHLVVVPHDRETDVSGLILDRPLPWQDVGRVLVRTGVGIRAAERAAIESRGYLRPLQRLLGARDTRRPKWILSEHRTELEGMLLLGAWEPDHEGDAEAIEALGIDPDDLERVCVRLSSIEETPIVRDGSSYSWSSPEDAWTQLSSSLTKRALKRFEAVAIEILGADDRTYELPPNERCSAAVFGPTLHHSKTLREGVAQSLLRMRHHAETVERRLGTGTVTSRVDLVVHQVLTSGWKRWASFENALWFLAEASPRVFLAQLGVSFGSADGVARVFEEEGDPGLHGAAPHLHLLRALELLCWLPRWMSEAAEALMQLAELDPPASARPRIHPRPLDALADVFHIGDPQTGVDDEERWTTLAELTRRHPARGFDLLLSLTHQLGGRSRPASLQPHCRSTLPTRSIASEEVQFERARRCLALALECAETVPERWASLVREPVNQRFSDETAEVLFERLTALRDHFDDVACEVVLSAVRSELVGLYATGLHERLDTRRVQLHRVLQAFEPLDPVLREAWRFKPQHILLEPHSRGDYRSTQARLDELRDEALARLLGSNLSSGVRELLRLVVLLREGDIDMRELGRALARSPHVDEFEELLLHQPSPAGLEPLVAPFGHARSYHVAKGVLWLRMLLLAWSEAERERDVLGTLLLRQPEPVIWDIVDVLDEPLKSRYWSALKIVGDHDEQQWPRAVTNLLEAKNVSTALSTASYRCKQLSVELLIQVLEAVSSRPPQERSQGPDISYDVTEILAELQRRDEQGEIDRSFDERLRHLEFRFITFFEGRTPRRVNAVLEEDPRFFVALLSFMYPAEGEEPGEDIAPDAKRMATNAYLVLSHWSSYPGRDQDPAEREQTLYGWVTQVIELARSAKRGEVACGEVATVLARVDVGEDGYWPSEAVRRLLQDRSYPTLRQELWRAVVNSRGATIRGNYEGGAQEEALVARHCEAAAALRAAWPATASLHEELAESYAEQARREDESAGEGRRRDGL